MNIGIIITIIFYAMILLLIILLFMIWVLYLASKYNRKNKKSSYISIYKVINVKRIKIKRYNTYILFFKPMIIDNENEILDTEINFFEYNNIRKKKCKICTIEYTINNGNKEYRFINAE